MKRIAQLAAIAILAGGVQVAYAQQTQADEPAEAEVNVAQAATGRYEASTAVEVQAQPRNMLHELGLGGADGFPTRGGPIDD